MTEIKIYNQWNAPKGKKQNMHQEIYKWQTIDKKTGEIIEKEENTQEKIQSNLAKVDYKRMIKNGELELNGINFEAGIRDYTSVSGDTVDTIDLLTKIASMDAKQVSELIEAFNKQSTIQPTEESKEDDKTIT